jgi:hypothetical protein
MKSLVGGLPLKGSAVMIHSRASLVFNVKLELRATFKKPNSTSPARHRAVTDFEYPIFSPSLVA